MPAWLPLLLAAAACGDPEAPDPALVRVEARRAALGLDGAPGTFSAAMAVFERDGLEAALEGAAVGRATGERALDLGLRVGHLLHAPPPDRHRDDPAFLELLSRSRTGARRLALAAARGDPERVRDHARDLVALCARCHNRYRR